MKKVILAYDSFKGCITAAEACKASAEIIREIYPEANVLEFPMSDGGEGLVECLARYRKVRTITINAHDALMRNIKASYSMSEDGTEAYMEMASTCGLTLIEPEKRNPLKTTTYGVGEMIADAIERGCQNITIGIGGSATCDAGRGMVECLMEKGIIDDNSAICEGIVKNGNATKQLPRITVVCDVNNPLYGRNGASYIFSPQKGATSEQVELLDQRLRDFARSTEASGKATYEMAEFPGSGAAGGLGYGLMAYLNAQLKPGTEVLLDIMRFSEKTTNADMIITGEGMSDAQTLMGKVPFGILSHSNGAPVHVLSGSIRDVGLLLNAGFASLSSINEDDNRQLDILMRKDVALFNLKCATRRLLEKILSQNK